MNITFPKVPTGRNFGSLKIGQLFTAGGNIAFIKAKSATGQSPNEPCAVNLESGLIYRLSVDDTVYPCAGSLTLTMEVM